MNIQVSELRPLMLTKLAKLHVDTEKAMVMVDVLLEGELLGHRTHGIQLFKPYIASLLKGEMEALGAYELLNQTLVSELWDGRYISGTWLTTKGLERAAEMARAHGIGTVVIRKAHHIACLAAYLEFWGRQGLMVILSCSDPMSKTVAPFGGTKAAYGPNPLAVGIPTTADPIMMDISTSSTANGVINKARALQQKLPEPWLLTPEGQPTDDPETFFSEEPSTILPLGGMDLGYKGFALGLMVEALTNALGGYGRVEDPQRWGASVFIQVIAPQHFSGESAFVREIDFLKSKCVPNRPIDLKEPVRMPGQRGLVLKSKQLEEGIPVAGDWLQWLKEDKV